MVDHLVMVNGLPGSGKSTLATELARVVRAPLVSKDAIKEALADVVPAAPNSALGSIAMETAWSMVRALTGTVILESWWFKPRDAHYVEAGLSRVGAGTVVEIWCDVPPATARRRYAARRRHRAHDDAQRLENNWNEWAALAEPLGVGRTVRVDTSVPVDIGDLRRRMLRALEER